MQRLRCYVCGQTRTLLRLNMLPHKHYAAAEIEQVLQGQKNPAVGPHECGAEESTIRRWRREFPERLSALAASASATPISRSLSATDTPIWPFLPCSATSEAALCYYKK